MTMGKSHENDMLDMFEGFAEALAFKIDPDVAYDEKRDSRDDNRETWEEEFDNLAEKLNLEKQVINEPCRLCDICKDDIKQFISDLLKERDKEWLSCLPEELDENSPYFSNRELKHHTGFNHARIEFLENAKAKKFI